MTVVVMVVVVAQHSKSVLSRYSVHRSNYTFPHQAPAHPRWTRTSVQG